MTNPGPFSLIKDWGYKTVSETNRDSSADLGFILSTSQGLFKPPEVNSKHRARSKTLVQLV